MGPIGPGEPGSPWVGFLAVFGGVGAGGGTGAGCWGSGQQLGAQSGAQGGGGGGGQQVGAQAGAQGGGGGGGGAEQHDREQAGAQVDGHISPHGDRFNRNGSS